MGLWDVFRDDRGGETLEWALAMGLVVIAAVAGNARRQHHAGEAVAATVKLKREILERKYVKAEDVEREKAVRAEAPGAQCAHNVLNAVARH